MVTLRNTDVGQLVSSAGGQPLFQLTQSHVLRVFVHVPEAQIPSITKDQEAKVSFPEYPGREFEAVVVRTAGAIDLTTAHAARRTRRLDNAQGGEVLAGSHAEVRFTHHRFQQPVLMTLPVNALLFRSEGPQAGVVQADGKVEMRSIGQDGPATLAGRSKSSPAFRSRGSRHPESSGFADRRRRGARHRSKGEAGPAREAVSAQGGRWPLRLAEERDIPAIEDLIPRSVRALQAPFYSPVQMAAALGPVFGVDRMLIRDGTYFVAEEAGQLAGCGGWSKRRTLFGGDREGPREDDFLDPAIDSARIRAFFVHPEWARRGIGAAILAACEANLRGDGFLAELVATLAGEPFYEAYGYRATKREALALKGGIKLLVRMWKSFPPLSGFLRRRHAVSAASLTPRFPRAVSVSAAHLLSFLPAFFPAEQSDEEPDQQQIDDEQDEPGDAKVFDSLVSLQGNECRGGDDRHVFAPLAPQEEAGALGQEHSGKAKRDDAPLPELTVGDRIQLGKQRDDVRIFQTDAQFADPIADDCIHILVQEGEQPHRERHEEHPLGKLQAADPPEVAVFWSGTNRGGGHELGSIAEILRLATRKGSRGQNSHVVDSTTPACAPGVAHRLRCNDSPYSM